MAVETRRLCKLLSQNEERNHVHKLSDADDLVVSAERDPAVNSATVKALLTQELAAWVPCERFPRMLKLSLTQEGLQCAVTGSNGYLRRNASKRNGTNFAYQHNQTGF